MLTDTHRPPESSHTETEPYICRRFLLKAVSFNVLDFSRS